MESKATDITWYKSLVSRADRERMNGHKSVVLWFTGLSASGKSTLAHATEERLFKMDCRTYVMDGDNVRHGLCSDLGFTLEDRHENLRRVGETAKLLVEAGVLVLTAFISPLRSDRESVRSLFPHGQFIEIFCDAGLEVCEQRDPKDLYKRARRGEIANFTGISSPYEDPLNPELRVDSGKSPVEDNVDEIIAILRMRGILPA